MTSASYFDFANRLEIIMVFLPLSSSISSNLFLPNHFSFAKANKGFQKEKK